MFNAQRTTHNAQRKGQHLAEYALIFSLVLAALTTVQTYVKRGLQGRYKDATDEIVSKLIVEKVKEDATFTAALQYEPYYTESNITTEVAQKRTETVILGGSKTITIPEDESNTTTVEAGGYRKVLSAQEAE